MRSNSSVAIWLAGMCLSLTMYESPTNAQILYGINSLFSTGVDSSGNVLANGATDPHYAIVANSGDGSIANSGTVITQNLPSGGPGAWVPTNTASAWVEPAPYFGTFYSPTGSYDWQTTFTLPHGATSVTISGDVAVDDDMPGGILLNGTQVLADPTGSEQFAHLTPFTFTSSSVVPGTNTLGFQTYNGADITGLRVDAIAGTYTLSTPPIPTQAPLSIHFQVPQPSTVQTQHPFCNCMVPNSRLRRSNF